MRPSIAVPFLLLTAAASRLLAEGGVPPPSVGGTGPGPGNAQTGHQGGQEGMMPIVMMLVMGFLVLMMFTTVRKQKREERERKAMVEALKTGTKVVTVGGIHGTVVRKGEETADIQTGGEGGSIVTIGLNAIAKVIA